MIVTGRVETVIGRATNYGHYYDVQVDGKRYGTGKVKPLCSEGDFVSFDAEAKEVKGKLYYNADPESFKKATPPAGSKATTPSATTAAAPKQAWVPDKERQDTISFQAARKDALQFTELLLNAKGTGLVDFGKMKGAEAIEVLEKYVDSYTERFFADTKNLGHVEAEPNAKDTFEGLEGDL